jgi:flagellar biosynthesis protein FliP
MFVLIVSVIMYAPVPQQQQQPAQAQQQQQQQQQPDYTWWYLRISCYLGLLLSLTLFLVLTYQTCVICVMTIAFVSLLLIQVPLMPIVFGLSMFVLMYHAVDYRNATVKVEVPLSNFVYVPTIDDMRKYVHMSMPDATAIKGPPPTTPTPWRPFILH